MAVRAVWGLQERSFDFVRPDGGAACALIALVAACLVTGTSPGVAQTAAPAAPQAQVPVVRTKPATPRTATQGNVDQKVLKPAAATGGAAASTRQAGPASGGIEAAPTHPCAPKIVAARNSPQPEIVSGPGAAEHAAAYEAYDQGRYVTALTVAEAAAGKGDPQAHTLVARIHDEGLGVPKDPITAARWYARAAQLCDVPALFALGLMLAEGRGIEKDRVAAAEALEAAALSGHALANYNLGLLFLRGDGKPENVYRAAQHIRYAAEKGVSAAQYDIAVMYLNGSGVPVDGGEASRWMNRAAVAGYTAAQYDYAVMLLKGLGLERDKAKVYDFMLAAADKGVPGAQNRLAHMFKDGVAVDRNLIEAAKWRSISSTQVDDPALDAELSRTLSKADRLAADKAAAEWRDRQQAGIQ